MALAFGGGGFGKELRDARPGQAVIDIALVGGLRAFRDAGNGGFASVASGNLT